MVTGKTESQINLEVALKLQEALSNQGYTVVMCRTSSSLIYLMFKELKWQMRQMQMHLFVYIVIQVNHLHRTLTLAPFNFNRHASIASQSQSLSKKVL